MLTFLLVLFLSDSIQNNHAQHSPKITNLTQTQVKGIGESAKFSCSVQYAHDYSVLWLKIDPKSNDSTFIATENYLIKNDPRYQIHNEGYNVNDTNTYTLQIKNLQEADAGIYRCQITMSVNSKLFENVELRINRPPVILNNTTRSFSVSEGEDVELECCVEGQPLPRIKWRHEDDTVFDNTERQRSTLTIKNIKKHDRGVYFCVAENGVGRSAVARFEVEIKFAPVVTVRDQKINKSLGENVILHCHVEAVPSPSIVWIKDSKILTTDNIKYFISHFSTEDDSFDTTIRIKTLEEKDFGEYICQAVNKLGSTGGRIEVVGE